MASAAKAQRLESIADLEYTYDGVQLYRIDDMPLIQDFLSSETTAKFKFICINIKLNCDMFKLICRKSKLFC